MIQEKKKKKRIAITSVTPCNHLCSMTTVKNLSQIKKNLRFFNLVCNIKISLKILKR